MSGRDTISIRDLRVDCVVGVYPHERDIPQPLVIDLDLHLDTEAAALRERLHLTVDYAATAAQIAFLLKSCRFRLLETAAHALARYLLLPVLPDAENVRPESLSLKLTKPGALEGAAIPSLRIERQANAMQYLHEEKSFGTVDVIHETRDAGIYRLNVAPGREIPLHVHRVMQESEMVLTQGLLCQGKPIPAGTVHRWPLEAAHTYKNASSTHQSILCVDCPRFIETDEIQVKGSPAAVPSESYWTQP